MANNTQLQATLELNELGVDVVGILHAEAEKHRSGFEVINHWEVVAAKYPQFAEFAKNDRASFIPRGGVWDGKSHSNLDGAVWDVECSASCGSQAIEEFVRDVVPHIVSKIQYLETCTEGWTGDYTTKFKLEAGKVVKVEPEDDYPWERNGGYGR